MWSACARYRLRLRSSSQVAAGGLLEHLQPPRETGVVPTVDAVRRIARMPQTWWCSYLSGKELE